MKHLLIFFILLNVHSLTLAQLDTSVVRLKEIGVDGILLNKGWKFQRGDNLDWSRPGLDDGHWLPIDPSLEIPQLPQLQQSKKGWFRLRFSVDSSAVGEMALMIQQSGASTFYLDGRFIHSFGTFSNDPHAIVAYDPLWKPVSFPLNGGTHVLAVRYALQPGIRYTSMFEVLNPAIWLWVKKMEPAVDTYTEFVTRISRFFVFIIGVCFILTVVHLALYFFYRVQKANLYFGLYALFLMLGNVIQLLYSLYAHQVIYKFYLANFAFGFMLIADLLMLTALYHLLQQKTDKVYWTLFFLMFVAIVLNAGPYYWGWRVGGALYEMLLQLSVARISFLAIRRKKRGAWIIAAGALFYVILFPLFLAQGILSSSFLLNLSTLRTITYVAARFSIPIATSIYLGLDIAFTSRRLQKKLIEVNQLSEKTLAQEQEKQEILANQKKHLEQEVLHRTNELTRSLEELKATQSQLIQKEKMASLGELTAGIAHEIQNPLNFVNNFSDVNAELVDELQAELKAGNTEDAFSISNEIKDNEQKINHHGKRADAIVKGMLQHSRASSGKKEPTDINALADEYLRLSYHGLRAKDKDFNADFKTDFDETIGNIEVVPQDIGRVLLNLYNNAFYAVYAKKKQLNGTFEPTVEVSTKRVGNNVMITVKDNGTGIPQKVLDKIYQPFFTTKPTGQGTGLGLSLSYDIIKAHGGEIRVESKEGEYTECVVQLPGT